MRLRNLCIGVCICIVAAFASSQNTAKNAFELEKMVVTGTRRPVSIRNTPEICLVANREEIASMQAQDVSNILDYLPGLSTEGGTGGGLPFKKTITINGMPVQYSAIMVDGTRLLSSHIHTGVNINMVPPDNIERIELLKSAASAQYGSDALGGVLNIITKKGSQSSTMNFSSRVGSQNTYYSSLSITGPINQYLTHSVYSGWEQSDGLPIQEPSSRVGAFSFKKYHLMDRIDAQVTERFQVAGSVHYFTSEAPFGGEPMDAWLFTPKTELNYAFSPYLKLSGSVYYTQWNNEKNNEFNENTSPEVTFSYSGFKNHILLTGGEFSRRNFTRKMVEEHKQNAAGFFVQDEYLPFSKLTVLTAVRVDAVDNEEAADAGTVFSPKISLLYRPVSPIGLRFSAGRGFRVPTVQDLYETLYGHADDLHFRAGNKNLKPEYATNLSSGIEWNPLSKLNIMVNGYANFIEDMITPVDHGLEDPDDYFPGIGASIDADSVYIYQRENIHRAFVAGGECMFSWNVFKGYKLSVGASLIHNENRDTQEILPYYPGQTFFSKLTGTHSINESVAINGFAGVKATRGRSIWTYKHSGPQKVSLEDYQKVDTGLSLRLINRYELFLAARNILGQEIHMYEDKELLTEGEMLFEGGLKLSVY